MTLIPICREAGAGLSVGEDMFTVWNCMGHLTPSNIEALCLCNRASIPSTVTVGSDLEDPDDRADRHVYNSAILVALELADILAPVLFMGVASIIYLSNNNSSLGLGPNLKPTSLDDIRSGWKWACLLSGIELAGGVVLGLVVFRQSGVNAFGVIKMLAADNMNFLARMIFSKYVFVLYILLSHSGCLSHLT